MRVLFDISVLGYGGLSPAYRTGVYRSVERLGRAFVERHADTVKFCAADSAEAWALSLAYWRRTHGTRGEFVPQGGGECFLRIHDELIRWNAKGKGSAPFRLGRRVLREMSQRLQFTAPRLPASEFSGAVYHSPFYGFPAASGGAARVLTINDLVNLSHPELTGGSAEPMRGIVASIRPSDWIVCISEWTRNELLSIVPSLSPERVRVVLLGVDGEFRPCTETEVSASRAAFALDRPYFLSVATQEKRKNLPFLIGAFDKLLSRRPDCQAELVLIGAPGGGSEAVKATSRAKGRVRWLGFVNEAHLAPLYTGALAFAFPSLFEGFGLPALEAMQCGCPVIASQGSALTEVVGEGGERIDPRNEEAWSHALEVRYDSETERAQWRAKGTAWVSRFSWKKTADDYMAIYRQAFEAI